MSSRPVLEQYRFDLHRRRIEKQELIKLRQRIIEGTFLSQVQNERDMIASRMNMLQAGPRRAAMQQRLTSLQASQPQRQFRRLRRIPSDEQVTQYTTQERGLSMPPPSFAPSLHEKQKKDRKEKRR